MRLLPTVAIRGPFLSYLRDNQGQGHRYDTIDSAITTTRHGAKLAFVPALAICSITTQHLINRRKFTSWNYLDSNCAQTRFEIIIIIFLLAFY